MQRWLYVFTSILCLGAFHFSGLGRVQAQAPVIDPTVQPQITVIINQVRGQECCNPGGINELRSQLNFLRQHSLNATFAIRYDALQDPELVGLLKEAQQQGHELSGLLEITPALASQSGVVYHGTVEKWYEAQNAFLIGYSTEDRKKIIDQYFKAFRATFGVTPSSTTAWMIDAGSLQYLKATFGVQVHQLTREQWGLDSYTLYGGPAHYPYRPSSNWALIPTDPEATETGPAMPVIVRQTITDPVWVYGDTTSSYTSQPNDYRLGERGLGYFEHLFNQAHRQPTEPYTFALIGLENSMPSVDQDEYGRQLELVARWKTQPGRAVLTATQFGEWFTSHASAAQKIQAVHGRDQDQEDEQVWIIGTPQYRVRLRLSEGVLFVSDIRLYNQQFTDPYQDQPAENHGYWVVPFVLDFSRFGTGKANDLRSLQHDVWLKSRSKRTVTQAQSLLPVAQAHQVIPNSLKLERQGEALLLRGQLTASGADQVLARFSAQDFTLARPSLSSHTLIPPQLQSILRLNQQEVIWVSQDGSAAWSLKTQKPTDDQMHFIPSVSLTQLQAERSARYPFLFPELHPRPLSPTKSLVIPKNTYAMAGRNPVRLAVYPRDEFGYPVEIPGELQVVSEPAIALTQVSDQDSKTGMVFVDLTHNQPAKVKLTIAQGDFSYQRTVYFAINCKAEWQRCLQQPQWFWWYARNWMGDWWRVQRPALWQRLQNKLNANEAV